MNHTDDSHPVQPPDSRPPDTDRKKNRPLRDEERRLLTELRENLDDPKRSKAIRQRLLREMLTTEEAVLRQRNEIEIGDGFKDAHDFAFGKAPQEIQFDGAIGFGVQLPPNMTDDLQAALAFLAITSAVQEREEKAKVESDEGPIVEMQPQRAISSGSDNTSYVNSGALKQPVKRRLF